MWDMCVPFIRSHLKLVRVGSKEHDQLIHNVHFIHQLMDDENLYLTNDVSIVVHREYLNGVTRKILRFRTIANFINDEVANYNLTFRCVPAG